MVLQAVCHGTGCPGGRPQRWGQSCLFSARAQGLDRRQSAEVAGIQAGRALRGWRRGVGVGRGHRSRCFLSVGGQGGRGVCLMTETSGSVTSPFLLFSHLPFPTCVSQRQVNMVTRRSCRVAMCFQGRDWQRCVAPCTSMNHFHPLHLPSVPSTRESVRPCG